MLTKLSPAILIIYISHGDHNIAENPPDGYALRMVNIEKHFGLVRALTNINLWINGLENA
jgi:hypothetical protein